jgi:hypothetical protein
MSRVALTDSCNGRAMTRNVLPYSLMWHRVIVRKSLGLIGSAPARESRGMADG